MVAQNPLQIKEKIVSLIKIKGPSLPIQISREIQLETLFTSAFLSELASEGTIKISNLKVGSSPLYFFPGQESALERFSNYLPGKEKEAFALLKEKKVLSDKELEPAIRVALRSIKDFSLPFVIESKDEKILCWRFHNIKEEEARSLIKPVIKPEIKPRMEIKIETKTEEEFKKTTKVEKKEIEKPLLILKEKPKQEIKKEKSEFVNKILSLLEKESLELIEEKEAKKKDFSAIIRINSDIGKIKFLLIAKDKKSITENDLTLALQKAQSVKMPLFLLATGSLNKKASSYLDSYSGLIKFRHI